VCQDAVPEDAVAGFISLVRANDGNVAGQSSLHQELLAIEHARLPLLPKANGIALVIESSRNLTIL
jgi:hypothetical protein